MANNAVADFVCCALDLFDGQFFIFAQSLRLSTSNMTKYFFFTAAILLCSCASRPESSGERPSFDIDYKIVQETDQSFTLECHLGLKEGSYVVSPKSTDSIYGKIEIRMDAHEQLLPQNELEEQPSSIKEFDSIIKQEVFFIRESTIFKQEYRLKTAFDFEISGILWFVLEPKCAPYDNHFTIKGEDGNISVLKGDSHYSANYKR